MKKALPFILLAGAAVLFCVGIASLAANLYLSRGDRAILSAWKAPLDEVEVKRLTAANALGRLAGIDSLQVIDESLQQGDWESAFATVAYAPDLSDADRAGSLLLLGSRYAAAGQTVKAYWCYQYASTLMQLSPEPSDLVRAQTLLEAAQGLSQLALSPDARRAVDQAYLIAEYSVAISHDPRARLFERAAGLYQALGAGNLAAQARGKADQASSAEGQVVLAEEHRPYRMTLGQLPVDNDLSDKVRARISAAKELVDELNLHPPKSAQDLPEERVRAIGDALYQEDAARQAYYDQQLGQANDPAVQAALLMDKARWLAFKLQAARGGFGLSLVAEWESEKDKLGSELSDSLDVLYKLDEQQASSPDMPADADRRLEDVLRGELVAGRWGLYAYDEGDLRARLGEVSSRLRDQQAPALRLDSYLRDKQAYYLLVPDELYGQGESALPK